MELVSVIIPVYNVEPYLLRCVDSVRNQTYQNLEIILVDDGSPDRCPQICDELQKLDPRIKVVHKENGGLGFARNSGLEVATGAYVTFIDSDDWISECHVENLYTAVTENQADMAIGAHTSVSAAGEMQKRPSKLSKGLYEGEAIIDKLLLPMLGAEPAFPQDVQFESSSCMNLYRMDVIRENDLKFLSERYAVAEDLYFNVDFLMGTKRVVLTEETGYYYFENLGSISRKYNPKRFERTLRFYETLKSQIQQYKLVDRADYRVERTFLMKVRVAIRHVVLSDLPRKQKMREIRTMLNHPLVQKVLHDYPIHTMIPAMRLLSKWMRSENVQGVYWLMKVRESARRQRVLIEMLKKIGLGK